MRGVGREKRKGRTGLGKEREGEKHYFVYTSMICNLIIQDCFTLKLRGIFTYKREQSVNNECKAKKYFQYKT